MVRFQVGPQTKLKNPCKSIIYEAFFYDFLESFYFLTALVLIFAITQSLIKSLIFLKKSINLFNYWTNFWSEEPYVIHFKEEKLRLDFTVNA